MLKLYLTGGETNSEPNKSLGANTENNTIVSIFEVDDDTLNNLFDNITIDEILNNGTGIIENYRVLGIKNYSPDFTSTDIFVYFYDTTDEIIGDVTISYEMALSKYKNYYSGFPPSGSPCDCSDEYSLPLNSDCFSDIYDFDFYDENNKIYIDVLYPDEYMLLYIKRKVIINSLTIDSTDVPKISKFKIKVDWVEE